MKKRFQDILSKPGKKNGLSILACAVLLAVSAGMLAGCTVVKDRTESTADGADTITLTIMKEGMPEESITETGM